MGGLRIVAAMVLAGVMLGAAPGTQAGAPVYHWRVIGPARTQPTFYWPSAVAVDSAGRVDVLDRGNARIVQLSPAGQMIRQWGGRGVGPGRFGPASASERQDLTPEPPGPAAMAVDRWDNVYVADSFNNRIEKFSSTGRLLAIWPQGSSTPVSLAVGPRGALFVAEAGTEEIVKLSPIGKVLATWTNLTAGKYSGLSPDQLAVDAGGRVFVRLNGGTGGCSKHLCWDRWFSYVEIYSPAGRPERTLSITTCSELGLSATCPLGADRQGRIVAIGNPLQVTRLAPAGNALMLRGGPRTHGYPAGMDGLAFDRQGNLYTAQGFVDQVARFSPDGTYLGSWGIAGEGPGQLETPTSVAVNPRGMLAVEDSGNSRIQVLSSGGDPLSRWHVPDNLIVQSASTIAIDGQGDVYRIFQRQYGGGCTQTGCFSPGGIEKYSPAGRLLARWMPNMRPYFSPLGITMGPRGNLYVIEVHNRVVEISERGRVLASWPTASDTPLAGAIAVGAQRRTYVSEYMPPGSPGDRIEVFAHGKRRAMWTGLPNLAQLAVGPSGALYGTEPGNDRVIKLSPAGKVWGHWGQPGYRPGHFNGPFGVAVDGTGNVYVSDEGNDRIQERVGGSS